MKQNIYLDYQATTPVDPRVMEVMLPWFSQPSNPHAIEHRWGQLATEAVEIARSQVASLVNCDPNGVIFTSSATEAANIVIRSLAESNKKLVLSSIEHPCVSETAESCSALDVQVEIVPVENSGIIDLEYCSELLEDASLVSIMAVNNEIGTIQPIEDLAVLCSSVGVPLHVDATQAVGKISFDMGVGITFATISAHKIYGPVGIGAICTTTESLRKLKPIITGGGQQNGLRAGTLSTALSVGFGEACAIAKSEIENDSESAKELSQLFLEELDKQHIAYSINGSMEYRVPQNLNISFDNILAEELIAKLPNIAISTGSACSTGAISPSKVLLAMNHSYETIESSIRVGFGRFSTVDEIVSAANQIANAILTLKSQK